MPATSDPIDRLTLHDEDLLVGNPLLLVIDVQSDFMHPSGPFYVEGVETIIPPMSDLLECFRSAGLPIIFTREAHRPGGVDAGLEPDYEVPTHTVLGTEGYEIIPELAPRGDELVIDKRRYTCFLGTELDLLLRKFRTDTLVICGLTSDCCVHWTAGEAWQKDYHVRVIEDCTYGTGAEAHKASLKMLRALTTRGRSINCDDIVGAVNALATNQL
jgi:nicotinamidase-related amidase